MAADCKFGRLCGESFDFGHRGNEQGKPKLEGKLMTKRKDQIAIVAAAAAADGEEEEEEEERRKGNMT